MSLSNKAHNMVFTTNDSRQPVMMIVVVRTVHVKQQRSSHIQKVI